MMYFLKDSFVTGRYSWFLFKQDIRDLPSDIRDILYEWYLIYFKADWVGQYSFFIGNTYYVLRSKVYTFLAEDFDAYWAEKEKYFQLRDHAIKNGIKFYPDVYMKYPIEWFTKQKEKK